MVILVARNADRASRRAVFVYLAVTHLGGVGTWIAILLLAHAGAIGDPAAISSGSGLQTAIALTALVGMGTKAGVMPFHVWLPRAHPIAPAPVSALMSGVMIKAAIYALVRVLVDWLGVLPIWIGVLVLALGALSAVGGVVYALFQHDLKRLLAFHSIENIGIIVLGIGACLSCTRAAPTSGRPSRSPRRCCTRSTTRSSRRCSSSAPARSRRRSARSSSTGSAACCGGCRGPAAPSSSVRWRSPGCRR